MCGIVGVFGHQPVAQVIYDHSGYESVAEAQPFYVNSPYGIVFAHNGNLTNVADIVESVFQKDLRHLNTTSDSEVMLNVFAHALSQRRSSHPTPEDIFAAVEEVHRRCHGGYAVVVMIAHVILAHFDTPVFDGTCITGDVISPYLKTSKSDATT